MTGGSGLGAKMDVVVGTGGSVIDFKIADRGIGYKVGDVLSLEGLPFNPVGVGSPHSKLLLLTSTRISLLVGHSVNYSN